MFCVFVNELTVCSTSFYPEMVGEVEEKVRGVRSGRWEAEEDTKTRGGGLGNREKTDLCSSKAFQEIGTNGETMAAIFIHFSFRFICE